MYQLLRDQLEKCWTRQTHEGDEDNEDEDVEDESMDVDESEEDVAQKNRIVCSIG
jgi:hypothetical protein